MYRLYERFQGNSITVTECGETFDFNTQREAEECRRLFQESNSNNHYFTMEISKKALDAELRHNANVFSSSM